MTKIRKLAVKLFFGEVCTCGPNDGCFICSPCFRFWEYVRECQKMEMGM